MYTYTICSVSELPSVLPVVQLSEALLRLEKGAYMLTRLIANMPDTFDQGNLLVHVHVPIFCTVENESLN